MIQSKDRIKNIFCDIVKKTSLTYSGAAFPPKNSAILVGALPFLENFGALTSNFVAFVSHLPRIRSNFRQSSSS